MSSSIEDDIPFEQLKFFNSAFPDILLIRDRRVHCTSCGKHIGTAPNQEDIIRMHPVVRTLQCKECHTFYNSGEFDKGDDGSELYCRWCGQGGEVYCCVQCPFVFCKKCIVRNFSKGVVYDIAKNDNWMCFGCNSKITWHLRAEYWALIKYIEMRKLQIYANKELSAVGRDTRLNEDETFCCKRKRPSSLSPSPVTATTTHKAVIVAKKSKSTMNGTISGGSQSDDNDIVCTPDIYVPNNSFPPTDHLMPLQQMIEDEAPPAPPPVVQPQIQMPPLQLVQSAPRIVSKIPTPSPQTSQIAQTNQPSNVVRQMIVGKRSSAASGPVYHTINGFRIDLNSVAQRGTYRLPNGKLIQVKRQTANERLKPRPTAPKGTIIRPVGGNVQAYRQQLPTATPAARMPGQLLLQPQANAVVAQPQIRFSMPIYNGQAVQSTTQLQQVLQQLPAVHQQQQVQPHQGQPVRYPIPIPQSQAFPNTPVGANQAELAKQIFAGQDICQQIIGKLNTLMTSNAYTSADKFTDVRELYIHVSYLLTYTIGRFKSLQDKCHEDMARLDQVISDRDKEVYDGVDANGTEKKKRVRRSSEVDDDIEIVEPNTTLIEINSDDDDDVDQNPAKRLKGASASCTKTSADPELSLNEKFLETLNAKVQTLLAAKEEAKSSGGLKAENNTSKTPESVKEITFLADMELQDILENEIAGDKKTLEDGLKKVDASKALEVSELAVAGEGLTVPADLKDSDSIDKKEGEMVPDCDDVSLKVSDEEKDNLKVSDEAKGDELKVSDSDEANKDIEKKEDLKFPGEEKDKPNVSESDEVNKDIEKKEGLKFPGEEKDKPNVSDSDEANKHIEKKEDLKGPGEEKDKPNVSESDEANKDIEKKEGLEVPVEKKDELDVSDSDEANKDHDNKEDLKVLDVDEAKISDSPKKEEEVLEVPDGLKDVEDPKDTENRDISDDTSEESLMEFELVMDPDDDDSTEKSEKSSLSAADVDLKIPELNDDTKSNATEILESNNDIPFNQLEKQSSSLTDVDNIKEEDTDSVAKSPEASQDNEDDEAEDESSNDFDETDKELNNPVVESTSKSPMNELIEHDGSGSPEKHDNITTESDGLLESSTTDKEIESNRKKSLTDDEDGTEDNSVSGDDNESAESPFTKPPNEIDDIDVPDENGLSNSDEIEEDKTSDAKREVEEICDNDNSVEETNGTVDEDESSQSDAAATMDGDQCTQSDADETNQKPENNQINTESVSGESDSDEKETKDCKASASDDLDKISECGDSDFSDALTSPQKVSTVQVDDATPMDANDKSGLDPISSEEDDSVAFDVPNGSPNGSPNGITDLN